MTVLLLAGLLAGAMHVVSGPDHLAAVAPLTLREWRKAWTLGLRWGLGHASGVIFLGLIFLLIRQQASIEAISSFSERLVGVALIVLGSWGIRQALRNRVHAHTHTHNGNGSTHVHIHVHAAGHKPAEETAHFHSHAAFAVGGLHGLAGGSHLFGVIPALLLNSQGKTLLYLVSYGTGTVAAMICFAAVVGLINQRCMQAGQAAYQRFALGCSVAAALLGVYWLAA